MMCFKMIMSFLFYSSFIYSMDQDFQEFSHKNKQLTVLRPFFENTQHIKNIKAVMDSIEENGDCYEDYSKRKGGVWSNLTVHRTKPLILEEHFDTVKLTLVGDQLVKHNPETMSSYPGLPRIVGEHILPKMFYEIEARKWATIPKRVFAQLYIQRCNTSDAMDWHQDPGEDFTQMAHYSLIMTLSKQLSKKYGWNGGVLKVKPGLPLEECPEDAIETILHEYNQGVLFNNQENSHYVTEVIPKSLNTKRDILVLMICFGDIPIPVREDMR